MYYLYKKTHTQTGLQYLGYTNSADPFKYTGSGKYWVRHIKTHGYNVNTEILFETTNKEEIKQKGIYYSNLWNVVDSKLWANLKPETGEGGSIKGHTKSESTKEKYRNKQWSQKAIKSRTNNCLKNAAARIGSNWTEQHRQSRISTYVDKNLEIATKIIALDNQGLSKLAIAKQLNVSWDKVKYSLLNKEHFEARLKETQNY